MRKILIILILISITGCTPISQSYRQEYAVLNPIPELKIDIAPYYHAWKFEITNNSEDMIMFLINESSYVSTDKKTKRIIRGETRVIHSDRDQPSIPIPPNAMFAETIYPEDWAGVDNMVFQWTPLQVADPETPGKFYLTFEIDNKKTLWVCDIKYIKNQQAGFNSQNSSQGIRAIPHP